MGETLQGLSQESSNDAVFKSPAAIFNPASVAIVGASERAKWPRQIFDNLRANGYRGQIFPVNPRAREVYGVPCYPDLASLPMPVEHALVIVPAAAVQDVLEAGVAAGLKSATIYAGNIGEGSEPEVVARGRALKVLIDRSGLIVAGPNCMGGNALHQKFFGYPNNEICKLPPGSVAFASQSGGTLQFLTSSGADRGVNFSYMISSGNEISLDLADYVNFFVEDEHTRVIALFIEGIRRAPAFMAAAAKALAAGKPIVAIKTGKSQKSREAARSHTGAISGDYDVFTAMCERYGITIVPSLDDMVEVLLAFQAGRLPKGPRVGWVTTSGGTVDLLYDYFEDMGAISAPEFSAATKARIRHLVPPELALKNPLDAGIPSTDANAADMCNAVTDDPDVDMLAWAGTLPTGERSRDAAELRRVFSSTDKPVIGFARMNYMMGAQAREFQAKIGFPFLQGLQPTIRALTALAFYGARAGRRIVPLAAPRGRLEILGGPAFEAALAGHGLTPPRSAFAATAAEIGAAAARLGLPVALKIVSAQISHKTEVGGVRLDLRSAAEVVSAAESLAAAIRSAEPQARLDGFLVQEMVRGVEMIVGARTDPFYGPMLMVGAGGILVELVKDVAFRLLPVTEADARAMLGELKVAKLLAGFRGRPAGDVEALVKAICGLSEFYLDHRHLAADLEINPLIVLPEGEGVRAVDVRWVVG
jgi:acetyltransferase